MVLSAAQQNPENHNLSVRSPKSRAALDPNFDPERLVEELLSLGHRQITPQLARVLAKEVEKGLDEDPDREISAQWISQLVEAKLRDRGILSLQQDNPELSDEDTVSLSQKGDLTASQDAGRTPGLLKKASRATLPTLEKFLSSSPSSSPVSTPSEPAKTSLPKDSPAPPRARAQVHGAQDIKEHHWEARYEAVAQKAATMEGHFPSPTPPQTLAVEFYNAIANQEFYPHLPELLKKEDWESCGSSQVWMDLPLGFDSVENVLRDAQKVWQQGGRVSFVIEDGTGESAFTTESFENFLLAVERSLLELPDDVPLPQMVGLHLKADSTEAASWADLALSGKYYPKFSLSLAMDPEGKGRDHLLSIWHQTSPLLYWDLHSQEKGKTFPRWGGGPALEPYELCQSGSLNLSILAHGSEVDWIKLRRMIRTAVHFLDNLIEVQDYPLPTIAQRTRANRKISLGVMGFAELLIKLGCPYTSERALTLAEKITRFIQHEAAEASHGLAKLRGVFPNYSQSPWKAQDRKVRHRTLTGICPAPSLAALAGVTPGIGPLDSILQWEGAPDPAEEGTLKPHELLQKVAIQKKIWTPALSKEILSEGASGCCSHLPMELQRLFATRADIPTLTLARMQAAFERASQIPAGLCYQITTEDFEQELHELLDQGQALNLRQIQLAQNHHPRPVKLPAKEAEYELPLKEDSQDPTQPVSPEEHTPSTRQSREEDEEITETVTTDPPQDSLAAHLVGSEEEKPTLKPPPSRQLPEVVEAKSRNIQTVHGPMRVSLGFDSQGPLELMARVGKAGSEPAAQAEAFSRLISLLFSLGVEPHRIYQELKDIKFIGSQATATSIPDGLAKILAQEFQLEGEKKEKAEEEESTVIERVVGYGGEEEITEVVEAGALH